MVGWLVQIESHSLLVPNQAQHFFMVDQSATNRRRFLGRMLAKLGHSISFPFISRKSVVVAVVVVSRSCAITKEEKIRIVCIKINCLLLL